ncbi:Rst1 [Thalictrum thalictroides]|uniref:Rst1 n=1 Tax=Thalictrum thalictroides TaxID=46969 RepID=A0A7J6XAD2_THATH|nr:Rst1 [Thalictrum thalictroides]
MDSSYTLLLERTRVPQPSLQKLAVISIFQKLQSAPLYLNPDSNPGRDAITQCLTSNSSSVIDQSIREICRLVKEGVLNTSRGLLELQSSLEGCDLEFVDVFVKGIGFIVRIGFQKNEVFLEEGFDYTENHPFVRVLACGRSEVQSELVKQVLLFIVKSKQMGLRKVLDFLRPFLNFSILRIPFSPPSSSLFARDLVSSIAALSCSFSSEAVPVIKLLIEYLKYFPCKNANDFKDVFYIAECLVDAYTVVLTQTVGSGLMKNEVQLCGVELVETLLSFYSDLNKHFNGKEAIVELSKRLLHVQKQLGLHYFPELSSVLTSLFIILSRAEFEHEQLSIMKLSVFLLKWESENEHVVGRTACGLTQELLFLLPVINLLSSPSGHVVGRTACGLTQELLFLLPVINLLSSPSGSIKAAAIDLLTVLEKVLIEFVFARKGLPVIQYELPSISDFKSIICRLLQHLWFQEHFSFSSSYFLSLASNSRTESTVENSDLKSWISHLRSYCLLNVERQKSLLVSQRQKNISIEMSLLLGSVVVGLVMHQSIGSYAVDAFAAIGIMDPKLGLPQLLVVLFYSKFFCNYESNTHEMLLKLLELLPSVASHSAMTPLIVQTILPMLNKDTKPAMRATATRLLCKTWEITDRIFGTLQGILHPKAFSEFVSEKDVCISLAVSIRDVCRKNPDRGVDLILSVSECIGSPDPAVKSLGFQSLGYLCEADVVDFYTAWTVIGKHVMDYIIDPTVAHGVCALLRWGAMDAEAYSDASKTVLEILWDIGTSKNSANGTKWLKARCSAFESLTHYEVEQIQRCIPDFKTANMQFLVSEDNPDVLRAMEGFEIKIMTFEHNTRRRLLKQRKIIVNKVEKLLDAFPQVVFHSGNSSSNPKDLPGAALICFSFTPKELHNQGTPKELQKLHAAYETALVDIAESLQLSRNILIAMLSLQSWKPFMQRWVKAVDMLLNAKVKSSGSDKTSNAAADILKVK